MAVTVALYLPPSPCSKQYPQEWVEETWLNLLYICFSTTPSSYCTVNFSVAIV